MHKTLYVTFLDFGPLNELCERVLDEFLFEQKCAQIIVMSTNSAELLSKSKLNKPSLTLDIRNNFKLKSQYICRELTLLYNYFLCITE